MDFGANKTLTGGLALQTVETYKEFIGTSEIFLAVIILRFTLKKMILINLQRHWKNVMWNMFTLSKNIHGDKE